MAGTLDLYDVAFFSSLTLLDLYDTHFFLRLLPMMNTSVQQ